MTLKRILAALTCCFALGFLQQAAAQSFLVVYAKNCYKLDARNCKTPIATYSYVQRTDRVQFPKSGKMIVLNKSTRQLFNLEASGTVQISRLIPANTSGIKALSDQYFRYILQKAESGKSVASKTGGMPYMAASFRGQEVCEGDTLVMTTFEWHGEADTEQ